MSSANISDDLMCPICFHYLTKTIFNCINGHSICGDCANRIDDCPTCRDVMTKSRNYLLEKLAQSFEFPCTNNGCGETLKGGQIDVHNTICRFRPKSCIIPHCNSKVSTSGLSAHLKTAHGDIYAEQAADKPVTFDWNFEEANNNDVKIVGAHGEVFVLRSYCINEGYDPVKSVAYWALQLIGDEINVEKYMFEMEFNSFMKNRRIFFCQVVQPDTKSLEEMIEMGNCVGVPFNVLQKFRNTIFKTDEGLRINFNIILNR